MKLSYPALLSALIATASSAKIVKNPTGNPPRPHGIPPTYGGSTPHFPTSSALPASTELSPVGLNNSTYIPGSTGFIPSFSALSRTGTLSTGTGTGSPVTATSSNSIPWFGNSTTRFVGTGDLTFTTTLVVTQNTTIFLSVPSSSITPSAGFSVSSLPRTGTGSHIFASTHVTSGYYPTAYTQGGFSTTIPWKGHGTEDSPVAPSSSTSSSSSLIGFSSQPRTGTGTGTGASTTTTAASHYFPHTYGTEDSSVVASTGFVISHKATETTTLPYGPSSEVYAGPNAYGVYGGEHRGGGGWSGVWGGRGGEEWIEE